MVEHHTKTMGISIANAISWDKLKKLLIDEYLPKKEMQKARARTLASCHAR